MMKPLLARSGGTITTLFFYDVPARISAQCATDMANKYIDMCDEMNVRVDEIRNVVNNLSSKNYSGLD